MPRFLTGLLFLLASASLPSAALAQAVGLPEGHPVRMPGTTPASPVPAAAAKAARLPKPVKPMPGAITALWLESTADAVQNAVPLTFGQIFAAGDLPAGQSLVGKLDDGTRIALQVDVKASHADRSVRHAIISAIVPALAPGQPLRLSLLKAAPAASAPIEAATLLEKGFRAGVSLTVDGKKYQASADALLRKHDSTTWLAGPAATEWLLDAPFTDADGKPHPHLSARFAVRAAGSRARVDVTVENDWAFEPGPRNFTYDASISVGGKQVWQRQALTHFHHARWRKVFWWGAEPQIHVRHDSAYLIASRALPNYDQRIVVAESALAGWQRAWTGPATEPMGVGLANPYMPTTGGRPDLGLLPAWGAAYLLSMDARARLVTLGTADLAGSWSSHYRDKATGRPVTLADYPYMTILGQRSDTLNPATKKLEAFPPCATPDGCKTPNTHDASHQPAFAYLPYLLTGDYYYLEELQFWAMWNAFMNNPSYRQHAKGLLQGEQVRGQAWSLRTLAEAAYITPDADPFKAQLRAMLDANLDWYNRTYTNNEDANQLGALVHGYAVVYHENTGLAPWMDDFFTAAVGHVAELGFEQAIPLLAWKVRFPIARMEGKGACWLTAAAYTLKVRDSAKAPIYADMAQVWKASNTDSIAQLPCASPEMAQALKLKTGEMSGYASSNAGYPSNLQPALAYGAEAGGAAGERAWARFVSRKIQPDYSTAPQFAIIPRQ
ncbi:hypothetical protein [Massilia sp. CF038]|uniref:hypothetical protein n=1 Tax=Massilia sp. CF038 TaxID=1881045 RepID=UPI00091F9371|nr:hypothetical protein [Massilia sp. CF038]SHH41991.1 hypothetical protein SAMN05428948_3941 [Massilia sp. CF038]